MVCRSHPSLQRDFRETAFPTTPSQEQPVWILPSLHPSHILRHSTGFSSAPLRINKIIFIYLYLLQLPQTSNMTSLLSAEDGDPMQAVFPHFYPCYVTSCTGIWNFIPFLVCSSNSWKLRWDVHLYWTHFSNVSTALNNLTHGDAFYKLIFAAFFSLTWFTCQAMYLGFQRLFPSGDCISSFWQFLDSISKCNYCTLLPSVLESLEMIFLLLFGGRRRLVIWQQPCSCDPKLPILLFIFIIMCVIIVSRSPAPSPKNMMTADTIKSNALKIAQTKIWQDQVCLQTYIQLLEIDRNKN